MDNISEKQLDQLVQDERIPSFISDSFFTPKQWDALEGAIPMTQEMFDGCLSVCDRVKDGVNFYRIVEQFPHLEVNFSQEVCDKYKKEHDAFKEAYLARFGDEALFILD